MKSINPYAVARQEKAGLMSADDKAKMENIGRIYMPSILTPAHAPQKVMSFGNILLDPGVYVVSGSALHSEKNGMCTISIGPEIGFVFPNKQMIYGAVAYDANSASVTDIFEVTQTMPLYFLVWAETDFEITPISFKAVRIK